MLLKFASPLLLLAASSSTLAQLSPDADKCLARAGSSVVQQSMCYQAELTKQDARLNKAYQQLTSQYKGDDTKRLALRDEERTWLKKRDYDCKLDTQTTDSGCLVKKTSERADVLESKLKF